MFLGISCPVLYFNSVMKSYKAYAQQHFSSNQVVLRHTFWHALYCGFGFINFGNKDNIEWADECGFAKAQQRDPSITMEQTVAYATILKEEVISLIKKYPMFVLCTIFAKIGALLLFLLIFSNIGLLAAYFFPKKVVA